MIVACRGEGGRKEEEEEREETVMKGGIATTACARCRKSPPITSPTVFTEGTKEKRDQRSNGRKKKKKGMEC